MPKGWQWLNRISPTTWILYGLVGSQLSDLDNELLVRGPACWGAASAAASGSRPSLTTHPPALPPCGNATPVPQGYDGSTQTVSQFMETTFGYEQRMVWWCVLIVAAFAVVFRALATIALAKINFQRR